MFVYGSICGFLWYVATWPWCGCLITALHLTLLCVVIAEEHRDADAVDGMCVCSCICVHAYVCVSVSVWMCVCVLSLNLEHGVETVDSSIVNSNTF